MDLRHCLGDGILTSIASISLVLLLLYLSRNKNSKSRDAKQPPSPPRLPIIGNLHQLGKHPHLSLYSLAKKYGPIFLIHLGEVPTVILSSAATAKEALRNHDLALASRPRLFAAKYLFYDCTDIAYSPYGAYWKYARKVCMQELLSPKRVQSQGYVREHEAARLVERVSESGPGAFNLTKLLNLYANGVLCRVVFGKDFSGTGREYERLGFHEMLDEYQELLGGFSVGDFFPSMEFIHSLTGHKSRLVKAFRRFNHFFDDLIKERLGCDARKENKDFLDILLEVQRDEQAEMPLTMDNVKAILLDMFAAGTDTTFITLDWSMTELVTNPRVLRKVQNEVRSIVGERKLVTEDDLPHLHYMKAVIKEIFRLHPPVPVLVPRESMEAVTINGFIIPEKTRVFVNAWAVGRDPESWENVDAFEPERFVDSVVDFKGQDYQLIPFGAGRRSCPAIAFSSATVDLALAQLLHSFDWELPDGVRAEDLDMTEVFGISMHRASPLVVVAKPQSSSI